MTACAFPFPELPLLTVPISIPGFPEIPAPPPFPELLGDFGFSLPGVPNLIPPLLVVPISVPGPPSLIDVLAFPAIVGEFSFSLPGVPNILPVFLVTPISLPGFPEMPDIPAAICDLDSEPS